MAERRKQQKEKAQLDAEREMLQVQQEECARQVQKVGLPPKLAPPDGVESSLQPALTVLSAYPAWDGMCLYGSGSM